MFSRAFRNSSMKKTKTKKSRATVPLRGNSITPWRLFSLPTGFHILIFELAEIFKIDI